MDSNFIEVQRRRYRNRQDSVRGKATIQPEDKFKPADLKITLFLSNVHTSTSEKDIKEYIESKTKEVVYLQKIQMKNQKGYNAYKLTVPRHKIDSFLNDEVWTDGVTCRRFMPYRAPEAAVELSQKPIESLSKK